MLCHANSFFISIECSVLLKMIVHFPEYSIDIPNFSLDINVEGPLVYLSFDKFSKRIIANAVYRVVNRIFSRAAVSILKLMVYPFFLRWKMLSNRMYQYKISRHKLYQIDVIPPKHFRRRSVCIIYRILWYGSLVMKRSRFLQWVAVVKFLHGAYRKYFDKWNMKFSLLKLNRLTGRRFLYLCRRLNKYLQIKLLKISVSKWQKYTDWARQMLFVRRVFQCWRVYMLSCKMARRHVKIDALISFKLLVEREKLLQSIFIQRCHGILAFYLQRRIFGTWIAEYHKRKMLRRVFILYGYKLLFIYFMHWKKLLVNPGSSPLLRPVEIIQAAAASPPNKRSSLHHSAVQHVDMKKSYRKASYQALDSNVVYKRYVRIPVNPDMTARKVIAVSRHNWAKAPTSAAERAVVRMAALKALIQQPGK